MVLIGTGEEKESFQILESENTKTGIEYFYPEKSLKDLKIFDRLLIKKYVALLNKIQMIDEKYKFFFIEEQATAIQLLLDIERKPIFVNYKTQTIEQIKVQIAILTEKFNRFNKGKLSEFELKKIELEGRKKSFDYDIYTDSNDETDYHTQFVKALTNIYIYKEK